MVVEIPLLKAEDIEVKVKQITEKGALALLYKTARTDMEILDRVFGIYNWQCDYTEIKGNLYCTISIWDDEKKQWIHKQDCGIESREDGEGNEKKGEASDAFKRASTKCAGIGRELYTSPFIWLNVETAQDKNGKWQLKDRFAKFEVSEIGYDENRHIDRLVIVNPKTGVTAFAYGLSHKVNEKQPRQPKLSAKGSVSKTDTVPPVESKLPPNFDVKATFDEFCAEHNIVPTEFTAWRNKASQDPKTGVVVKGFKDMTPDEWLDLFTKLSKLASEGYFNE